MVIPSSSSSAGPSLPPKVLDLILVGLGVVLAFLAGRSVLDGADTEAGGAGVLLIGVGVRGLLGK